MIQDDNFDILVTAPDRIKVLGFKPQKELYINHLLPYVDELDAESVRFLEHVKTNLAKAVMLREMKPACGVWTARLLKYLQLHGLKFSKEDHIALIKLTYELVIIPDLDPCKVHKFATLFLLLTKKKQYITPQELTLPWRPLYELGKKIFEKSATHFGMYHYLNTLDASYQAMVKYARPYFDVNATKEILAELLPKINPWSSSNQVLYQLSAFLSVSLPPEHADKGHLLWFDEMMTLWDTCQNAPCGISELMSLFAGLAKQNPGAVDWTPHVPKIFAKLLHALNLPVSYKDIQLNRGHSLDMKRVASWIVWTINPDGVVLKHLRSFLAAVESYLHNANSGKWSHKLRDLLRKLAREFLTRVRREREKKFQLYWENKTPESYRLREEDITEFVKIVLPPTQQAVYNRSGIFDISIALQNLATLRPAIVIPPLLERLKTTLTSLTEPHRVTAAMTAIAATARAMLRGVESDYPEGQTHVVPFLMAVLPGLDPNDIKKTIVTLHYILVFSWMVPFIDCSSAHEYWDDLTEEELLTCESTAQMEDFVLVFLDRLFVIIESSSMEHVRLDTKESDSVRSKSDVFMETAIASAATAVIMQCSPKIFHEALRKFKTFATETTFEATVSGNMVGVLLRVFARTDARATMAAFLPQLCADLCETLSTSEAIREENPSRDLMYRLVLLKHIVQCDGAVLTQYMPFIIPVLDRALKLHASYSLSRACDVLSHILVSLCFIELRDWKSSPKDYGAAPEKWLPIREWGSGCLLNECKFKWYIPSEKEAECAQMLVNRYLKPEVAKLRQWLRGEKEVCRERRMRSLLVINAALACSTFYPAPNEVPVANVESQVPPTRVTFTSGIHHEVRLDGENVREVMTKLLLDVQARLLADKTDDTRGLEMLIQLWERVMVQRANRTGATLEARFRSYAALERALDGHGGSTAKSVKGVVRLRMLAADAVRIQDDTRSDLMCEAGITPSALKALHALVELSVNTYSSVRMLAQTRLYWLLSHYPFSYRELVPVLTAQLAQGGDGDEWHAKHKGIMYMMLGPRSSPLLVKQDWELVRDLWPAVLNAPLSEKPSMVRLEQAFCETLHRHFPTINTRLVIPETAVTAASKLLSESQMSEPQFAAQLNSAVENETAVSDKAEQTYIEVVNELVKVIETPNVQWRRLEFAIQMLSFCPSIQTHYPPNAVRAIVRSLIHDNLTVRRTALRLTLYVLKQRKHKVNKIDVDPYEIAGLTKPEKHVPGYRKDLDWALWSENYVPLTDEDWDKPWLMNSKSGFYAWPEKLQVAAPSSQQKFSSDLSLDEMEEGERFIYEFFNDDANVDKFVNFLTVEEKKAKEKFNGCRFVIFKYLFSQYGEQISDKFIKHALRCAKSTNTQDVQQRFAAEVMAATLRAPQYWPRERALNMYRRAVDIIEVGLTSVIPETLEDWGIGLVAGVEKLEPTRGRHVMDSLVKLCAPPPAGDAATEIDTSFIVCARLFALQSALGAMRWRGAPLAAQLLKRLDDANYIQHPYQNVRETVGSMLVTIFDTELVFPGGENRCAPKLTDFLVSIQPRLAALYDENGDIVIKTAVSAAAAMQCVAREDSTECGDMTPVAGPHVPQLVDVVRLSPGSTAIGDEAQQVPECRQSLESEGAAVVPSLIDKELVARLDSALRLGGDTAPPPPQDHVHALNLLTVALRTCSGALLRGVGGANGALAPYLMLRAACGAAARGPPQPHDELPRAAANLLARLALALHSTSTFDAALLHLEALADGRSWWARLACLDFAQPLLFYGLPMLCDQGSRAVRAEKFAFKLMRDPRLEVRQAAAKLLTGLMHCQALPNEDQTISNFMRSCRSKELVERHSGVLGLCAYLASRPYSLGLKLGDVLAELSRHTSAPDPIPATIRSSLADFRRTHQDDWPKHREQLTEEELDLLADLTLPPSYCA